MSESDKTFDMTFDERVEASVDITAEQNEENNVFTHIEAYSIKKFYLFVPPLESGKMLSFLANNADDADVLVFTRDFRMSFEFHDMDAARRAKYRIETELGIFDSVIFGDVE